MGFHIQICPILRFLLINFTKALCSSANELQQNSNASSREEYAPPILTVLRLHLTFVAFCLLPVIRKQFYVISMEFLSLSRRNYSSRNVLSGETRGETAVFAGYVKFKLIFLMSANLLVIMPQETF